ncbi:MAG: hypothetical protein JXA90_08040 [Planctomycetes bacterium]|nr:hypothetical protein [Planctomycetota bacterium]
MKRIGVWMLVIASLAILGSIVWLVEYVWQNPARGWITDLGYAAFATLQLPLNLFGILIGSAFIVMSKRASSP